MADVEDLMASASSSYDECCPSVVDPATLLALLAGKSNGLASGIRTHILVLESLESSHLPAVITFNDFSFFRQPTLTCLMPLLC